MQPVDHGGLLLDAGPGEVGVFAQGQARVLGVAAPVVVLHPAGPDEQQVAGLDVAAGAGGSDVEVLPFAARHELVVGDGEGRRRVVPDAFAGGVAPVVEQDAPPGHAVFAPFVYGAFVRVEVWAAEVGVFCVVVEGCCWLVRDVAEAVPLRPGLRVHDVDIVVGPAFGDRTEFVFEGGPAEGGLGWDVGG